MDERIVLKAKNLVAESIELGIYQNSKEAWEKTMQFLEQNGCPILDQTMDLRTTVLEKEVLEARLKVAETALQAITAVEKETGVNYAGVMHDEFKDNVDFANWFKAGCGFCKGWPPDCDIASAIGVSGSIVGKWRAGLNRPRGENFQKLYNYFRRHGAPVRWSF